MSENPTLEPDAALTELVKAKVTAEQKELVTAAARRFQVTESVIVRNALRVYFAHLAQDGDALQLEELAHA